MKSKVAIIGGGVAGLSAAHELIERGFSVEVYEKQPDVFGGKARSYSLANSGKEGRKDLPAEHGFRFFPGFYKHIIDTLERIPLTNNLTVASNLVHSQSTYFAQKKYLDFFTLNRLPTNLHELRLALNLYLPQNYNVSLEELDFVAIKIWQMMTSCDERINNEYDKLSTWDLLEANKKSNSYKNFFADQPRVLLAAQPKLMSARVGSKIIPQMLYSSLLGINSNDNVLNGPTNQAWIDPWVKYLRSKGVTLKLNQTITKINLDPKTNRISSLSTKEGEEIIADYYIIAIPVEAIDLLISPELIKIDNTLAGIKKLAKHVSWMNGIQFYLNKRVDIVKGHVNYVGTPWALTSVSQAQFWPDYKLKEYGDGNVEDIISVDISDWNALGLLHNKIARKCSPLEIKEEVWYQIKTWLNSTTKNLLSDEDLISYSLDQDIIKDNEAPEIYQTRNAEPLLVNRRQTANLKPLAYTKISNMFLAADYVSTNTELACMEGANEAARRATNAIISIHNQLTHEHLDYCKIWDLHIPKFLLPFKLHDLRRYRKGLPWNGELPINFNWIINKFNFKFNSQ